VSLQAWLAGLALMKLRCPISDAIRTTAAVKQWFGRANECLLSTHVTLRTKRCEA
jgi:hypothetical protein